jgi:acid phosphatase (class A)
MPVSPEESGGKPGFPAPRAAFLALALLAIGLVFQRHRDAPRFLPAPTAEFIGLFATPPAAGSGQTRRELDELLEIQRRRTSQDVTAARADRKTEVWQFAAALGLATPDMRALRELARLAEQVENDERPYVRLVKGRFLRLRPYELEPRLKPCIDDVRGDLSYPSGHATYGYLVAYLLADMVPERRAQLEARARQFARQRMVCGVHFASDIEAGRIGAEWLARHFLQSEAYRGAAAPAARELRTALGLPEMLLEKPRLD